MNVRDFNFKKMYGQNFLKDNNIVEKIVNSAEIKDNSLVIEIGPGSGMLTRVLSKHAKFVLAYEIDNTLELILDKELVNCSNVDIIYDDFLKRDVQKDITKYDYDYIYVVANLPYYITTPIITKLIEDKIDIEKVVVMVQKEVGDRFCAVPGMRDYNSLTIFLNYYFDIKKLFIVSRNNFVPKPNVDSIIVSLSKKKNKLEVKNLNLFFKLVRDSFKFKRKNIRNNLKNYNLDIVGNVLAKHGFDLTSRAEQIPIEVFIDISDNLE